MALTCQHEKRLCPFHDVGRELASAAGADDRRRVDHSGRDEQDFAGLDDHRRLAVQRVFPRAFEDVDDPFARMRVPGGDRSRFELDDHLDDFASGDVQVVPLKLDAPASDQLRLRPVSARPAVAISAAIAMIGVVSCESSFATQGCQHLAVMIR